jgi:hypothetical protein
MPLSIRQFLVQQYDVNLLPCAFGKALPCGMGGNDAQIFVFEGSPERLAEYFVVVDNEQGLSSGMHGMPILPGGSK